MTAQRGVVLVAVLVLLALLTVLATSAVSMSVSHRRSAARLAEAVQAEALADSAIRMTLLELMNPSRPRSAGAPELTKQIQVLSSKVDVEIERESGRLDLNTAPEDLLFAAFVANGWSEADARTFCKHIADWKDADDETIEYKDQGFLYGPRNAVFESVEELRQVPGSERISDALLGAFTVYTHLEAPNYRAAGEQVRRALTFANERQLGGRRWLAPAEEQSGSATTSGNISLVGEVIRLRACTNLSRNQFCRIAVVRLTGKARAPLQVFFWS